MKDYKTENIINFSLVGHASSGKTTFSESLALCSGTVNKAGTIESGSTLSDYRKQEISNSLSIGMSLLNLEFLDKKINIIDTPGYLDFLGEMKAGLAITEVACIMVNSTEGIEVGTELAWEYSNNNNQSKVIIINMCNRDQSDFNKVLDKPKYFVWSNNFDGLKELFPTSEKFIFVDENTKKDPVYDLYLMSLCKHFILSPSTMHYWAAYLSPNNSKICLAPKNIRNGSGYYGFSNNQDIKPNWWKEI